MHPSARPAAAGRGAGLAMKTTTARPGPILTRPSCRCCASLAPCAATAAVAAPSMTTMPSAGGPIPGARRRAAGNANNNHNNNRRRRPTAATTAARASGGASLPPPGSLDPSAPEHWREAIPDTDHCVLNFYHLVDLPDHESEIEAHRLFLLGEEAIAYAAGGSAANSAAAPRPARDVRGRIYLSAQGANCQAGGLTRDCVAYARWVASRPPFRGLRYTLWPSPGGHAHPRLRLKHRPSLISLAGGMERLRAVTDPSRRATPLEPGAWASMLATAQDPQSQIAVLDVRNDYEWDAGHFLGAARPAEEAFADTPVGGGGGDVPAPLRGKDKTAPVMMYCTGGIRCDVYSAFLREKGFTNLYTLEGGVQGYLRARGGGAAKRGQLLRSAEEEEGGEEEEGEAEEGEAGAGGAEAGAGGLAFAPDAPQGWRGSLFVFDDRLAVAPAGAPGQLLDAGAVEEERRRRMEGGGGEAEEVGQEGQGAFASAAAAPLPPAALAPLRAAVPCQVCGRREASLPHLNCANLDCNDLFLACAPCREALRGCCRAECVAAPRLLRPIKPGGHYASWQSYAQPGDAIATGRSREGRLARRARRREAWKARHKLEEEEQRGVKREVRRAVAAAAEAAAAAAAAAAASAALAAAAEGEGGSGGGSERARRMRELLERRRTTTTAQ